MYSKKIQTHFGKSDLVSFTSLFIGNKDTASGVPFRPKTIPGHVSGNISGVLQIKPLQGIANGTAPCQTFHFESPKHNAYAAAHCRETSEQVDLWEVMVTAK